MKKETFRRGEVIFRQGDAADCMYGLYWGSVGIYLNYGEKNQKLLTTLEGERYFGEMGMIEHAPRSATAVALENGTEVESYREEDMIELFRTSPGRVIDIMQGLSGRLRRLTNEYMRACEAASKIVKAGDADEATMEKIRERVAHYTDEESRLRATDF